MMARTCQRLVTYALDFFLRIAEALNLHILMAHQPQEYEHVCAYTKLSELPSILPAYSEKKRSQREADTYIREVQQKEQFASSQPQPYGNSLEYKEQD